MQNQNLFPVIVFFLRLICGLGGEKSYAVQLLTKLVSAMSLNTQHTTFGAVCSFSVWQTSQEMRYRSVFSKMQDFPFLHVYHPMLG